MKVSYPETILVKSLELMNSMYKKGLLLSKQPFEKKLVFDYKAALYFAATTSQLITLKKALI